MKDLGGVAFPQVELDQNTGLPSFQHFGMTLRDYFAAKALQSLVIAAKTSNDVDILSAGAYQLADAMIECRKDV